MPKDIHVIELLSQLIACPSVTPDDAGCLDIIGKILAYAGFKNERLRYGDVDNLWSTYGKDKPMLVFAGHTDVVPTGPLNNWDSPPFSPTLRNGLIYGRGASDMKAALAAMVIAARNFVAEYPKFAGSIAFLLTSDEEGPSINGTKKVMEHLGSQGIKLDYCLIGEPSSEKILGDQIRTGRRGSLHGKLQLQGKQGHVANPHLAKNPIHLSASALHELASTIWDEGNNSFPPTTFQITNIHAGTGATNVIPGQLEALFNLRFGTASTVQSIQDKIDNILRKIGVPYQIDWQVGGEPFLTNTGKFIEVVEKAIEAVMGYKPKRSTGGGTSDGRFIAPTGTEVVELGVLNSTAHHVNECVRVDDVENLVIIYQRILENIFRVAL